MAEISRVVIGLNRYATPESSPVLMYRTAASELLTLPQLICAVSLRAASVNEARAVLQTNKLVGESTRITAISNVIKYITESDLTIDRSWDDDVSALLPPGYTSSSSEFAASKTLKNFLLHECDVDSDLLPKDLDSFNNRMSAYAAIKPAAENATRQSQMTQIELKTAVSRRDVSFSVAANTVKGMFTSLNYSANSMKGA